jgi:hypothetical protein
LFMDDKKDLYRFVWFLLSPCPLKLSDSFRQMYERKEINAVKY